MWLLAILYLWCNSLVVCLCSAQPAELYVSCNTQSVQINQHYLKQIIIISSNSNVHWCSTRVTKPPFSLSSHVCCYCTVCPLFPKSVLCYLSSFHFCMLSYIFLLAVINCPCLINKLLQKLIVYPTFYGTERFITICTRAHSLSLPWGR